MKTCIIDVRSNPYVPKAIISTSENIETEYYSYDYLTNLLDCKLLTINPYHSYFQQVYSTTINEHELTDDMLDVI